MYRSDSLKRLRRSFGDVSLNLTRESTLKLVVTSARATKLKNEWLGSVRSDYLSSGTKHNFLSYLEFNGCSSRALAESLTFVTSDDVLW